MSEVNAPRTGSVAMNERGTSAFLAEMPTHTQRPWLLRLAVLLVLCLAWELWGRFFADPMFFSPPSAIVVASVELSTDKGLLDAFALTLGQLAAAFALALGGALIAGFLIGSNRLSYRTWFPLILLAYAIPQTTVLPLFILMFGPGSASKIAFGFSHGIFPILISVTAGLQN